MRITKKRLHKIKRNKNQTRKKIKKRKRKKNKKRKRSFRKKQYLDLKKRTFKRKKRLMRKLKGGALTTNIMNGNIGVSKLGKLNTYILVPDNGNVIFKEFKLIENNGSIQLLMPDKPSSNPRWNLMETFLQNIRKDVGQYMDAHSSNGDKAIADLKKIIMPINEILILIDTFYYWINDDNGIILEFTKLLIEALFIDSKKKDGFIQHVKNISIQRNILKLLKIFDYGKIFEHIKKFNTIIEKPKILEAVMGESLEKIYDIKYILYSLLKYGQIKEERVGEYKFNRILTRFEKMSTNIDRVILFLLSNLFYTKFNKEFDLSLKRDLGLSIETVHFKELPKTDSKFKQIIDTMGLKSKIENAIYEQRGGFLGLNQKPHLCIQPTGANFNNLKKMEKSVKKTPLTTLIDVTSSVDESSEEDVRGRDMHGRDVRGRDMRGRDMRRSMKRMGDQEEQKGSDDEYSPSDESSREEPVDIIKPKGLGSSSEPVEESSDSDKSSQEASSSSEALDESSEDDGRGRATGRGSSSKIPTTTTKDDDDKAVHVIIHSNGVISAHKLQAAEGVTPRQWMNRVRSIAV